MSLSHLIPLADRLNVSNSQSKDNTLILRKIFGPIKLRVINFTLCLQATPVKQGIHFSRHAVNTCSATPAALRIPCSVCSPAHTSVYGRSQLLNPLLTLLRLQGQRSPSVASPFGREKRHRRFSRPHPCTLDRGHPWPLSVLKNVSLALLISLLKCKAK